MTPPTTICEKSNQQRTDRQSTLVVPDEVHRWVSVQPEGTEKEAGIERLQHMPDDMIQGSRCDRQVPLPIPLRRLLAV